MDRPATGPTDTWGTKHEKRHSRGDASDQTMPRSYNLQIVTQEGSRFDADVESLRVPAADGYLGVRAGHAPMIAELTVGRITISEAASADHILACSGGILEVSPAGAVILADAVEESFDIDEERARQAEARARERLRRRKTSDIDASRAEAALVRAVNRIKAADKGL